LWGGGATPKTPSNAFKHVESCSDHDQVPVHRYHETGSRYRMAF